MTPLVKEALKRINFHISEQTDPDPLYDDFIIVVKELMDLDESFSNEYGVYHDHSTRIGCSVSTKELVSFLNSIGH
jgi:hypothetical protein